MSCASKSILEVYQYWKNNVAADSKLSFPEVDNWSEDDLTDAFYRDLKFGTGGLRGKLGVGPNRLNHYTVGKASQGLANYLKSNSPSNSAVAICYDTRLMSHKFAAHAAEVFAANGIKAYLFSRPEPTPVLSYAVRELDCAAGVCITASHNPAEYNGYKVYGADGNQITVAAAKAIQACIDKVNIFNDVIDISYTEAVDKALLQDVPESLIDAYVASTLEQSTSIDCSNLKVAYTPLNGTGIELVKRVLGPEGVSVSSLEIVSEQEKPDGFFPTCPYPNPEEPEAMQLGMKLMKEKGCDLLIATDPDADRVGVAVPTSEGNSQLLTGNEVGLLLLDFLANQARNADENMTKQVAATTIVSAPMADDIAVYYGFELRRTLTGFKFICEQAGWLADEGRAVDFLMGFEESCGYVRGTHVRDKDAIVSTLLVCELAAYYKAKGLTLGDALRNLYERFGYWRDVHISVKYDGPDGPNKMTKLMASLREGAVCKIGNYEIEQVIDYLNGAPMPVINSLANESSQILPPSNVLEYRLVEGHRIIIRPSGTEPKLKAYLFAKGATLIGASEIASKLSSAIKALLAQPVVAKQSMQEEK